MIDPYGKFLVIVKADFCNKRPIALIAEYDALRWISLDPGGGFMYEFVVNDDITGV